MLIWWLLLLPGCVLAQNRRPPRSASSSTGGSCARGASERRRPCTSSPPLAMLARDPARWRRAPANSPASSPASSAANSPASSANNSASSPANNSASNSPTTRPPPASVPALSADSVMACASLSSISGRQTPHQADSGRGPRCWQAPTGNGLVDADRQRLSAAAKLRPGSAAFGPRQSHLRDAPPLKRA